MIMYIQPCSGEYLLKLLPVTIQFISSTRPMFDVSDLDLLQVDLLASGESLFCSPGKRPTASDEVFPRHMNPTKDFLKVYLGPNRRS